MIFATNKPLRSWARILHDHDADLGDVIVDRLLERARVLKLDGPSIRSRHVPEADREDTPSTRPRVSGNRQSFRNPQAWTLIVVAPGNSVPCPSFEPQRVREA